MLTTFKDIIIFFTSFQQEPGANATEIFNGIQYVRPGNGFVPNFQLFQKIEINGDKEEPLYTFLKVCTAPSVFYLSTATCYKHEDIWVFSRSMNYENLST